MIDPSRLYKACLTVPGWTVEFHDWDTGQLIEVRTGRGDLLSWHSSEDTEEDYAFDFALLESMPNASLVKCPWEAGYDLIVPREDNKFCYLVDVFGNTRREAIESGFCAWRESKTKEVS